MQPRSHSKAAVTKPDEVRALGSSHHHHQKDSWHRCRASPAQAWQPKSLQAEIREQAKCCPAFSPGIWGWSSQHPGKACSTEVRSLFRSSSCLLSASTSEDCCQKQFTILCPYCKKDCIFQKLSMMFRYRLFIATVIRH